MSFLLGLSNFRGYVRFQGCNCKTPAEGFVSIIIWLILFFQSHTQYVTTCDIDVFLQDVKTDQFHQVHDNFPSMTFAWLNSIWFCKNFLTNMWCFGRVLCIQHWVQLSMRCPKRCHRFVCFKPWQQKGLSDVIQNMCIYHGPPKPTCLEVFMGNNLVFSWPKPLLFMVLGAHGILYTCSSIVSL